MSFQHFCVIQLLWLKKSGLNFWVKIEVCNTLDYIIQRRLCKKIVEFVILVFHSLSNVKSVFPWEHFRKKLFFPLLLIFNWFCVVEEKPWTPPASLPATRAKPGRAADTSQWLASLLPSDWEIFGGDGEVKKFFISNIPDFPVWSTNTTGVMCLNDEVVILFILPRRLPHSLFDVFDCGRFSNALLGAGRLLRGPLTTALNNNSILEFGPIHADGPRSGVWLDQALYARWDLWHCKWSRKFRINQLL